MEPLLDFEKSKLLAILGAVLSLLGGAGHAGISLIGLIAYLLGMYGLSRHYERPEIFQKAFMASIGVFVAALVLGYIILVMALSVAPFLPSLGLALIVFLVIVLYAAALLAGKYKRDLMRILGDYGDKSLAELAAKLYWWGALLTIVIIGLLLMLIASIVEIVVLAGLREAQETPTPSTSITAWS